MTTLGKILVFVNLVFSLVTGALIIMVFVTRANWKSGFDKVSAYYATAESNAKAREKDMDDLKKTEKAAREQLAVDNAHLKAANVEVTTKLTDANAEVEKQRGLVAKAKDEVTAATDEMNRRKAEVATLQGVVAARDQKLNELENTNKDFRDRTVAAELAYKDEHERNTQLLAQIEKMARENERLQASKSGLGAPAGATTAAKPPPQDVKGTVLESDPKSGLVTISLGSDSSLSLGNTLFVYRLEPKPDYVGVIRVVDVDFKQAVARAQMPLRAGPIQKGDIVSSRIATPR
jgi:hypothetical protein